MKISGRLTDAIVERGAPATAVHVREVMSVGHGQRRSRAPELLKNLQDEEGIARLAAAVSNGAPLAYEPTHVENFTSLQVSNAERYVFSNGENFELDWRMLSSHPHLSKGPRMSE